MLITGGNGQLAREMTEVLQTEHLVRSLDSSQLDVTNKGQVWNELISWNPEVIIHAAAYTQVDLAESNPQQAFEVNALGTRYIAEIGEMLGAKFVYISTDYVFDGSKASYYEEHDSPLPINTYGWSKRLGEVEALQSCSRSFVIRTSWLFGIHGRNFVQKILDLATRQRELSIVHDQIGSPTHTLDLARAIAFLMHTERYGIYHFASLGHCSWYELAEKALHLKKSTTTCLPCMSNEYPTVAARPKNTPLSSIKLQQLGFGPIPHWEIALQAYLERMEQASRLPQT
ncbi:dTDP-4-dehydrorhamnose reductase [Marinicrinis sediminis]|uniref:dTDP-4-dehydrorhamnose reductase n=1 Tax=Marinicrinis sediminis TaxID=1652465 RepID=A0ABW5RDC8_9BACL